MWFPREEAAGTTAHENTKWRSCCSAVGEASTMDGTGAPPGAILRVRHRRRWEARPMTSAEACVFCGIIDGSLPSSPVVDTGTVLAFMDIDPVTPGHVLVIPKEHLPDLADLTDALAAEMMAVARRVAAALRRSDVRCDGVNLFYADGEAAFQEVFHAHLHVFPRHADDGFVIRARWGSQPPRDVLDQIAATLAASMASGEELSA